MEDDDQQRFLTFLRGIDLSHYHQSFVKEGVKKISHLKHVDDKDLENIGLTRPERNRLKKKLETEFSAIHKLFKVASLVVSTVSTCSAITAETQAERRQDASRSSATRGQLSAAVQIRYCSRTAEAGQHCCTH